MVASEGWSSRNLVEFKCRMTRKSCTYILTAVFLNLHSHYFGVFINSLPLNQQTNRIRHALDQKETKTFEIGFFILVSSRKTIYYIMEAVKRQWESDILFNSLAYSKAWIMLEAQADSILAPYRGRYVTPWYASLSDCTTKTALKPNLVKFTYIKQKKKNLPMG